MRARHWLRIKARALAIVVLERTDIAAHEVGSGQFDTDRGFDLTDEPMTDEPIIREADSAFERWRALVAVAAPSLLDGSNEAPSSRTEADHASPRYASTAAATFGQVDRGQPAHRPAPAAAPRTPSDRSEPRRSMLGVSSTTATCAGGDHAPMRMRITDDAPPSSTVAETTAAAVPARHADTDRPGPVPTRQHPELTDRDGFRRPRRDNQARNSERPSVAPIMAVDHPSIAAVFAALRGRQPSLLRPRDQVETAPELATTRQPTSPRRPTTLPVTAPPPMSFAIEPPVTVCVQARQDAPQGVAASTPCPSASRGATDHRADHESATHRPADATGLTNTSRSTPTIRSSRSDAARHAPPLGVTPSSPIRIRLATTPPLHLVAQDVGHEAEQTPAWPALPASPLDHDGIAPNRLPVAVAFASPGPDAFGARWSAEQEAL